MKLSSFKKQRSGQALDKGRAKSRPMSYGSSLMKPIARASRKVHKSFNKAVDPNSDIAMTGSKGGKVERQRRQEREIDLELRNYIYR
jgi:hypothetical protein